MQKNLSTETVASEKMKDNTYNRSGRNYLPEKL